MNASLLFPLSLLLASPLAAGPPAEEPITFEASSGNTVDAFRGTLTVPENRADPGSRTITLSYIRFPATTDAPGSPIIYLAGGPGGSGSGTAAGPRFPLFMAMRRHGDVIAFDQRGTGESTELPRCVSSVVPSQTEALSDEAYAELYRAAAVECAAFWRSEGVDIGGYTTRESVRDLSALRQHLNADRMTLWGISYGTHLALAALDEIPDEIDRAILASTEGLDHTVKLPAETDAYFDRLQAAVDRQPGAKQLYPDIVGMVRRVHERLDDAPIPIELRSRRGDTFPFLLQRRHLQLLSSRLIADPESAALVLGLYRDLDRRNTVLAERLLGFFTAPDEPITLAPMSTAMDVASGMSAERLAYFDEQSLRALLGGYLNFPMPQLLGAWPDLDLGPDFRDGPTGDTPILLLSGTLDGRTYPDSQCEAVTGLTDVTTITIQGAGHNLFMTSPGVGEAMHRFLKGERPERHVIEVEVPDLALLPDWAT